MRASKIKLCKVCKGEFKPFRSTQVVCGRYCAVKFAQDQSRAKDDKLAKAVKAQRSKETRAKREAMKTKPQLTKEAQTQFNRYIRARDFGKPCISCGATPTDDGLITGSRIDAGHYRSTGACPELRFEVENCHAQCVKCNRYLSGNAVDYRIGLIQRIGEDKVNWLEGPHSPKRYDKDDLRHIRDHYRKLANKLEKEIKNGSHN